MRDDEIPPTPISIPIEPELDLHAFNPRDIPSVVEEYVTRHAPLVSARFASSTGGAEACSAASCS